MNIDGIKADLQMIGSRIVRLDIKNDYAFFDLQDKDVTREIDVRYKLSDPFFPDEKEEVLAGSVMLYINVAVSNAENEILVDLQMEGCFVSDSTNEENLRTMVSVNGTAALYSIARGIISNITSQMCENGTIIIPMLNMYEMKEKTEGDE